MKQDGKTVQDLKRLKRCAHEMQYAILGWILDRGRITGGGQTGL